MLCSDVMKKNVECLSETDTAQTAAQRMREKNIGFIPVCDGSRKVVGTITDRDLAVRVLADASAADTPLNQVMSKDMLTCKANDDLKQAQDQMGKRQKSRIVCIDDDGRPIGVISLSDVVERTDASSATKTMREITSRETHA